MPNQIEADRVDRQPSGRRRILAFLAFVFGCFLVVRYALSSWVNLLWFQSLNYGKVLWTTWEMQAIVFAVFATSTFLTLFGILFATRRALSSDLPSRHKLTISGQEVHIPLDPVLNIVGWVIPFIFAFGTGISMSSQWEIFALFVHATENKNIVDPIFGRPLGFFLFTLPAWESVSSWFLTLAVTSSIICLVYVAIAGGLRALNKKRLTQSPSPWRPLSATLAFLLLAVAMDVYVSRFNTILAHHTIFDGITYTDAHVILPGLLIVVGALMFGSIVAALNSLRTPRPRALLLSILPAIIVFVILNIVSWYVGNFVVKPNELVREKPYIGNNIALTRQAFGLDKFVQREFAAETSISSADPANNRPILQNIRLWDWRALQDTLRQVQEIRTYYDFPDIDIDRYNINGTTRQVMLAARELNVEKLPESSRNWINEKLIYTHGYGVTMNPVNGFTSEGLPNLLLSNMPVQSTVAGLSVKRPEIYFGELTDTDVYVKTRQQEFDYPQGENNNLTSYQGSGGIALGGFFRRLILALDRDDLGKLPFSDDVNSQSRLLMHRNIRERVAVLAPFLTFEQDPYLVISEDGRLSWIIDAFTTSDSYPYSTHYNLGSGSANYLRNSVKVVVDAYNGTTNFYVFDGDDPVLATYRKIFPSLFKDASSMPSDLQKHIRYPELLFKTQSDVYGLYHMTTPEVFFNREDLWTVATQSSSDANGQQVVEPMHPNFVLMRLPGESNQEFVEILPFTPANRNNLIGWIAGRSDGEHYGTSIVYDFPKTRLVDGPQQIEARIDQNAQLSGQLTLWNQQGSHVLRGSLLVIPIGHALLYAEPIYLQAQQSPMPELRIVVLALQDKLAYGPTFDAALASLFGSQAESPTTLAVTGDVHVQAAGSSKAAEGRDELIRQAGKEFADYQRLTAAGSLGEAGQRLELLKQTLDKLQRTNSSQ